jgi:ribonuclease Z
MRVNVWRGALDKLGLPVGPWLNEAKRAVRLGQPDDTLIAVSATSRISLGELKVTALRTGPGQVVAYVVDCGFQDGNVEKILALARDADQLFIEAVFLEEDGELAERHRHLTATQAGYLARLAGARHVTPLHFSARYLDRPEALCRELDEAFHGAEAQARVVVA